MSKTAMRHSEAHREVREPRELSETELKTVSGGLKVTMHHVTVSDVSQNGTAPPQPSPMDVWNTLLNQYGY